MRGGGVQRRPAPPPMQAHDVRGALLLTAVWVVATVVLAVLHRRLAIHHETWWLATALAGIGLGVVGTGYLLRRRARAGGPPSVATDGQEWPNGSPVSESLTEPGGCSSTGPASS